MKVNLIQFEVNNSADVKIFADMFAAIGVSLPTLENSLIHAKINQEEPQRAKMTTVTNQLAKAIGNKPTKLDTKQRAKIAANARWDKKRASTEKKLEKATEQTEYIEVTDPTVFDPDAQPEDVDCRHIIEGNY